MAHHSQSVHHTNIGDTTTSANSHPPRRPSLQPQWSHHQSHQYQQQSHPAPSVTPATTSSSAYTPSSASTRQDSLTSLSTISSVASAGAPSSQRQMKPSRPQDYHDRDVLFSHQTPPHGHGSISSNSDSVSDANAVQTGTTGTYSAAYPSSPSSIATYANYNSSGNVHNNNNSSSSSSSPRHGHPQQQQHQQHQHQHQHHGKHGKHSKHGSDNRDDMSKSSSAASVRSGSGSGSGYGNSHGSSYDPDSPSIQQTLYPIPSQPSHEGSGSGSIPTTITTAMTTGEPVLGENVMLQEWLQKRSASLQLVWKRRWCVLRDDRLYYYRSNTDPKPIGVLHLAEYSVLTYGPDISRKSKYAFRLSSPVSTAHQQQHHLFYTDSAQSLHNWTYSLQLHISRTAAAWADVVAASTGASLHGGRVNQAPAMAPGGEQSIIDKVLDRLHLEDTPVSSSSSSLNLHGASALQGVVSSTQSRSRTPAPEADQNQPPFLPHIPTNFPLSVEDNNDTYSSTSSIPNSSHNISSNLEDIFNLSHQSSAPVKESSMESMRNPRSYQQTADYSYVGLAPGGLQQQPSDRTASNVSIGRYPTAEQESDMSEGTRSSMQSTTDQGRTSLQQPRPTMAVSGHGVYPIRSSVYSGVSMDNSVPSPTTSAAGSPYSSPVLTFEPSSVKAHYPAPSSGQVPPSPRTLYEILDNSSPKRPASAASSTSISTIASFGDASTYNDNSFDTGAGTTESNNVQGPTKNIGGNVGTNHGPKLFGFVTGGKHRKKERPGNSSSASSSHSGSGSANSSGLKLFTSGICSYSGCVQQAKTCIYHNKKYRLEQSRREDPNGQEKAAEGGKSKKFWQGGSDRSQGTMSALASPLPLSSHGFSSPTSSSFSGAGGGSRGLSSKSMVSLSRDSDMTMEASSAPLPPGHLLGMVTSPAKRRSPSVSVVDDALVATQQQMQQQQQQQKQRQPRQPYVSAPIQPLPSILTTNSKMPPPAAAPIQALLPPPHHVSIVSHHQQPQPTPQGESELLNRNMEAQIGPDFGAFDPTNKSALAGSALDGKFFVANHHRTMQTLQAKMHPAALPVVPAKSPSPLPTVPQLSDIQLQQRLLQQQTNDYNGGVSRRIIAPDELALAIREEAEEMQRKQAQLQEAQRNRPTSMIRGSNYPSSGGLSTELSTVSETSTSTDEYNSPTTSRINSPQDSTSSQIQEGIERIINYQDSQLKYATGQGEVQSLDSLKSPISRIAAVTHPHSPAATVPLSPSVLHPSGSASTIVNSGILSPGIQTGYAQQSHHITNSSSSLPTSLIDDKQSGFPTSSLLPPKRRGKDLPPPQGSASGYESRNPGRGEGGHVREMSVHSPIPLTTALPKDAVIHYGGALATHTTAGSNGGSGHSAALATGAAAPSLRPGPTTRRGSASPVMIRLNEHGGQNISPLLGTGVTKTFVGEAPSSDIGRPDLTPTTSPSSSSLSTSTVTSSLSSFVTSRNIGSDSHGARTGAAMKESLAMSGLEQGQPTPVFEVTSPTIPRNKTFQSAHSPLASMTPANGASPSGSPVLSVGSSPSATTTSDNTHGTFSAIPVTAISAGDEGHRARSALAHGPSKSPSNQEGAAAPRRMMLQSAASFVFPAPSPSSTKSAGTADGSRARSGSSDSGSSSGTGDDYDHGMSGQSSQAGSPVISPSIHAAALEMYPGLRKLSLFTAAVGGHPPPALIGSRKNSDSGLSSASSRDYGSQGHQHYHGHHYQQQQTTSKLRYGHRRQRTSSSDDGGYEDEEEDGDSDDHEDVNNDTQSEDLQHDEDWAGNWRAMRRPNEPAAEATIHRRSSVPALQSSLASMSPSNPMPPLPPRKAPSSTVPTSLSSPPPFLETSGSNIKFTPTPKPPTVAKPVSSPLPSSILTSITSSSTPLPTSSLTAMPPIQPASPSQALFGTGAGGAPPTIPPRSPRRSVPASPTTLRSPRSHQNLPTVSAMHSNNSGNDNVNEGAKSSTQQ